MLKGGDCLGEMINLNRYDNWKENINKYKFNKRVLTLIDEYGKYRSYMFIVIENIQTKEIKITGYSKYFIINLRNKELSTLESHAKIIIIFLNYVFFEKYEQYRIKKLEQLSIDHGNDFLRDYSLGVIGEKNKTKSTVQRAEYILNQFYLYLDAECEDFNLYNYGIIENNSENGYKYLLNRRKKIYKQRSLFLVSYPNHTPSKRIKYISPFLFLEILKVCDIYYPELKLALCLQAFGGLRRGEVCNVTKDKIQFEKVIDEFAWFTIDLRSEQNIRADGKRVGGIKKKRVQPIHPAFLKVLSPIYKQHLELIRDCSNPYGALFLNKNGDAMTKGTYEQKFKRIIKMLLIRLKNNGDFNSLSEMNLLLSGKINTHVLRHFFTKFIFQIEKSRNPCEIAYWRGDSSLESALAYLVGSPVVDEKIQLIQEQVYGDFNLSNENKGEEHKG